MKLWSPFLDHVHIMLNKLCLLPKYLLMTEIIFKSWCKNNLRDLLLQCWRRWICLCSPHRWSLQSHSISRVGRTHHRFRAQLIRLRTLQADTYWQRCVPQRGRSLNTAAWFQTWATRRLRGSSADEPPWWRVMRVRGGGAVTAKHCKILLSPTCWVSKFPSYCIIYTVFAQINPLQSIWPQ